MSLVNDPQSTYNASKLEPELLQRMDSLYAFYHKQWWCYKNMLNHFKCRNALFNGLALLLMAIGMIVGPVLENVILVTCLAAVGSVVKGWNDFKNYRFKEEMSRFAFTTYAKTLIELRTFVRGLPPNQKGVWMGFLSRCKPWMTLSSTLHPPCLNIVYRSIFVYIGIDQ